LKLGKPSTDGDVRNSFRVNIPMCLLYCESSSGAILELVENVREPATSAFGVLSALETLLYDLIERKVNLT
jgi:hypothetical protein